MNMLTILLAAVPPLPDPPLVQRFAMESPLLPAIGLIIIGILVGVLLARRAQAKAGGLVALLCALAAGCLLATGALVTTDREVVLDRSRAFIEAVAEGDADAAEALMSDSLRVEFAGEAAPRLDKETMLGVIRSFNTRLSLSSYSVPTTQASIDGGGFARSQIQVRVTPEMTELPTTSWWRLDWRQDAGGRWRINGLECLLFNGREPGLWLAGEVAQFAR